MRRTGRTCRRRCGHGRPAEIGGIDAIRFGPSFNTERTRGYQHLLYMELADLDALVRYQKHPVHQKFLKWVLDRDCEPVSSYHHYCEADAHAISKPLGLYVRRVPCGVEPVNGWNQCV